MRCPKSVLAGDIGNILYGDRRESSRESFTTFLQVSFYEKSLVFICIKVLAGPHKSLYLVAFVR